MARQDEKTLCRTPTPGKKPTRIPSWKYDLISAAVLRMVGEMQQDGLAFKDLIGLIGESLPRDRRAEIGSLSWHTTSVKLEMEVRGDIVRHAAKGGQRLYLPAFNPHT